MFCVVYQMMLGMNAAPQGSASLLSGYADGALVAEWARLPAAALLDEGVVHGADGLLMPEQALTREQTLAMLWRGWQSAAAQADWNEIYSDADDLDPIPEPDRSRSSRTAVSARQRRATSRNTPAFSARPTRRNTPRLTRPSSIW